MEILNPNTRLQVLKAPGEVRIKDGEIHWSAEEGSDKGTEELIQIQGEADCEVQEILELRLQVEPCPCENGGICIRSRSRTVCECSTGFKGNNLGFSKHVTSCVTLKGRNIIKYCCTINFRHQY